MLVFCFCIVNKLIFLKKGKKLNNNSVKFAAIFLKHKSKNGSKKS